MTRVHALQVPVAGRVSGPPHDTYATARAQLKLACLPQPHERRARCFSTACPSALPPIVPRTARRSFYAVVFSSSSAFWMTLTTHSIPS